MDGGDFKEQLDKDIAYAKSSPYEIRVECDEGLGSITSIALLSQKVTDQFNVEFKIASGVQFVGWKAYSKSSDGTYNEISEDYIKFLSYNTESNDGIYKASVKFVKGIEGIVIKPYCFLLPCVSEITPKFESAGCEQNNTIKITFNKPVNEDSFGDFTCITITDGINNLTEHFNTPSFTPDKKSLCITMKLDNPVLAPNGTKEKLDLSVRYNFSEAKDADGLSLTETGSHEYRITKELKEMPKIAVQLKSDSAVGTFESSGQKEFVEGYPVEIQFTLANTDDYRFESFEAVSSSISAEELPGKITFGKITRDNENGVYKTTVSIIEEVSDLVIQPVCTLVPKVAEVYPPNAPTGYDQDTTVKITFNKPVNPTTFDFSKITIKAADKTVLYSYSGNGKISSSSYYDEPYFSSDNTILYIPTVKGKTLLSKGSMDTKDVILTIDLSGTKDTEGFEIAQCEAYTYRLNGKVDNIPPELSSLELATTGDTSAYYYRTLSNKAFSDWSYDTIYESDGTTEKYKYGEFSQNHVAGTVHITVLGSDNASGMKYVTVKETLERNSDGSAASSSPVITKYGSASDFTTVSAEEGTYTFDFDYTFKSSSDGIIKLEVSLTDNSDNTGTTKNSYVLKNTVKRNLSFGYGYYWDGLTYTSDNSIYFTDFYKPEYNSATGQYEAIIKFKNYKYDEKEIYPSCYAAIVKVEVDIDGKKVFETTGNNFDICEAINSGLIKRNPETTSELTIKIYDDSGLATTDERVCPKSTQVLAITRDNNGKATDIILDRDTTHNYHKFFYQYKESENAEIASPGTYQSYKEMSLDGVLSELNAASKPDGIYLIYAVNLGYGGYSTVGKPFVYYKGNTSGSVPSSDPFDGLSITLPSASDISYPSSTGKAYVPISAKLGQKNFNEVSGDYTYVIKATWDEVVKNSYPKTKSKYSVDSTLELPTGSNCTISVVAYDAYGNSYESSSSYNKTITLNHQQNIPPVIEIPLASTTGGSLDGKKAHVHVDQLYQWKINSGGKFEKARLDTVTCYFVKDGVFDWQYFPTLEDLESKSYLKLPYKVTYTHEPYFDSEFYINFDALEIGKTNVYCCTWDTSELKNFNCVPTNLITRKFSIFYTKDKAEVKYTGETKPFTFTIPKYSRPDSSFPESTGGGAVVTYYHFNENDNSWVLDSGKYNSEGGWWERYGESLSLSGDKHSGSFAIYNDYDCFHVAYTYYGVIEEAYVFLQPRYFFPNYVKSTTKPVYQSTSWVQVTKGYQVFTDAPVLIHTLYARNKLTETDSDENAGVWEARAQEAGIMQKVPASTNTTSFTYETPYSDIPEGYYYTTIAHFANGKVLMGEIKQK